MQSNKLAAIAISAALLAPALPAFAQTTNTAGTNAYCTNLANRTSKIDANMQKIADKVSEFRANAGQKGSDRWAASDQKIATARANAASKRDAEFAKLESKATTDAQKSAASTFEAAVKTAISTRQSAMDAAKQAYRDGITSALASNASAMNTAAATYKSSVDAALAQAAADCANGVSGSTVRTNLKGAIQAARDAFKSARSPSGLQSTREQLAATRKSAIQQANDAFKAAVESARQTLQAAWGNQ